MEILNYVEIVFATFIPNKKSETIMLNIINDVEQNSIICTDESKSYSKLAKNNFLHKTVQCWPLN